MLERYNTTVKLLAMILSYFVFTMYLFHFTKVANWNGTCSSSFHVFNGVRQGAILSPVFCCVYFEFSTLCWATSTQPEWGAIGLSALFVDELAYADDLVLLAPANAIRCML